MYTPTRFQETDSEKLHAFIEANSFATLVSHDGTASIASHLPLLLERPKDANDDAYLLGHVARSNSQWQSPQGEVLAIFTGPHAYISPTWYGETDVVPTWNYVAVHVYGRLVIIDDPVELTALVLQTVSRFEAPMPEPWRFDAESEFMQRLLPQIVGFKIPISRIEGQWKLNQHHPEPRRQRVIEQLQQQPGTDQRAIADLMRQTLE